MKEKIRSLAYLILVTAGFLCIYLWITTTHDLGIEKRFPGMDGTPENIANVNDNVVIGEFFKRFIDDPNASSGSIISEANASTSTSINDSWPRFRGSNFDAIVSDASATLDLTDMKNSVKWTVDLGDGHAGPVVFDGMVYILDYDETRKADTLRCFSLETGKEIWRRWYNVIVQKNHGMSRTIPAVNDSYIVTLGPQCHVMCLDRKTGDLLWSLDLVKEFNTEVPLWYAGQCPLIDRGMAIIAPGGKSLIAAIDLKTGKTLWEVPNKNSWAMSHSSIMPGIIHGQRTYVYSASGGVIGISAMEGSAGEVLWESDVWKQNIVAPSPVILKDNRIFLCAGYGAGSMMIQVNKNGDKYEVEKLDEYKPDQGMALEQQTAVYYKDHLFGIMPNDAGVMRNRFVCYSPDNLRKPVWVSSKKSRFGLGPFMVIDDKFFILNDDATLSVVSASTTKFEELHKVNFFKGHDAWAPMAYSKGKLLLRDEKKMACISIGK